MTQPPADSRAPSSNPLQPVLFEVKRTIVGQDVLLERMAIALLSGGHLLVEGVPGLAKTLSVKSLAAAVGGEFQRIQFTPDLVPADIVGTRIYNQKLGEFQVALGPIFALSMKRSTWASGRGYVPSDSIGFCVAITRNGSGTRWVSRPIVT